MASFIQVTPVDYGRPILVNVERIEGVQPSSPAEQTKVGIVYRDGSVVPIQDGYFEIVEKLLQVGCAVASY